MGKPVRVLHVITELASGGGEMFIMNMYRNIDRSKVQFDFLLRGEHNYYKNELEQMGSHVYYTASFPGHMIRNYFQVKKILKANKYDIIHVHANALYYMTAILEAKRQGVRCRIMHSHSSSTYKPRMVFIHSFFKNRIHKIATHCFCCSEEAGNWMFGNNFKIINNAIDLKGFQFNEELRQIVRQELNIPEDAFVIGHVGRFYDVKNHLFLVEIFKNIVKRKDKSILVMVGEGELRPSVEEQVGLYGLNEKVMFTGMRKDVNRLYNAFDLFVLPSLFEGLPIVTIEAQANGLPVFCSDVVSKDINITPCMHFLSLSLGAEKWADEILQVDLKRINTTQYLINARFDIREEAKRLQDFYLAQVQ